MANGMNSTLPEPIAVTLLVIDVLEELKIPYVIVGSLASTQHGTARSTLDSDLVVSLNQSHISPLISKLQSAFYADEQMAQSALDNLSSFNLIHLETMFKVDLFIAKDEIFDQYQLSRRIQRGIAEDSDRQINFLSAEDTILAKLKWYRMGREQSERQWRDVVGVLKVQKESLDFAYMHMMANELNITDLLTRLLK